MAITDSRPLGDRLRRDLGTITAEVRRGLLVGHHPPGDLPDVPGPSVAEVVDVLAELLIGNGERRSLVEVRCRAQADALATAGRPQHELVDLYDRAASTIVARAWQEGRPGEHARLVELTGSAEAVLEDVRRVVADAYWARARNDRFGRRTRHAFADALLHGRATEADATAAGMRFAEVYRTVVLRSADPTGAWRGRASELLHDRRIAHCELPEGLVLFDPDVEDSLLQVDARLGVGQVAAGSVVARRLDLPAAVLEARLAAQLALTSAMLDQVVAIEQLPVELTLLRDEPFAAAMRAFVEPIRMHPDLLHTVRELYRYDLNRTSTARSLGITRGTLSGRLDRIRDLTGLDPTSTRGIQILCTALSALSLQDVRRSGRGA